MKFNSKVLTVWAKWFAGMVFGAIIAVNEVKGYRTPFEFKSADWVAVGNSVWAALVPVFVKYFNPKDDLTFLKQK